MNDKPINDLRRRMIAEMTIRSFGDKKQYEYIQRVEAFAKFIDLTNRVRTLYSRN